VLKRLDVPTDVRRTCTGEWEQFGSDAFPAATSDLYEYRQELNPGSVENRFRLSWNATYSMTLSCCKEGMEF